ncbi:Oidioi.mRNA.OKI2018_I69.chr2.g4739.t1.cds [Oikopleura dioica]|uniref:Oidioi.mRNA.OKI2018_I69.chr2.g4739.t1.cds n=1 Tax=Oikopleura dioica TaxID=34765 RepID=A0ABN7SZV7_OIKDI|nr:Oidioi.mRNA.OKI2018_I69.chr2.g4739.t1.cds [Oikopleura dioica]
MSGGLFPTLRGRRTLIETQDKTITVYCELTSDGHADPAEACDAIILHNTYRANHNAAPFGIPSAALCQGAQAWADSEAAANAGGHTGMTHSAISDRPGEGENMAWSSATSGFTLSAATTLWQAEDAYWNFDDHQECTMSPLSCPSCDFGPNPNSFGDCGHFTQNVWKATTSVCVAKAVNSEGTYIVARYEPGGNIMGQFVAQVDSAGPLDGVYVGEPHQSGIGFP